MSIEKSYFDLEPIKDIDEFINRVKELNKKDQWIFRGQKESNWKLIPGTGRYSNKSYDKVLKIWVCQKACPHHQSIDWWHARGCKQPLGGHAFRKVL